MKIFNNDGKGYYGIMRPDDDDCRYYARRAREAYDKFEAATKDDDSWREFLSSDEASRHNMAELIEDIACVGSTARTLYSPPRSTAA